MNGFFPKNRENLLINKSCVDHSPRKKNPASLENHSELYACNMKLGNLS